MARSREEIEADIAAAKATNEEEEESDKMGELLFEVLLDIRDGLDRLDRKP